MRELVMRDSKTVSRLNLIEFKNMKNIVLMMMCLMTLFSCSKDEALERVNNEFKDVAYIDWNLAQVSDQFSTFQFNYQGTEYEKTAITREGKWETWTAYTSVELLSLYFDDGGAVFRISCSGFDDKLYGLRRGVTLNGNTVTFQGDVADTFRTFFNAVMVSRAEKIMYEQDVLYNSNSKEIKEQLVRQMENKYKSFLDKCIPVSSTGTLTHDGNIIRLTIKCAGGERIFAFTYAR